MQIRKLNVRLILIVLGAAGLLGLGTYALHTLQVKRNAQALLLQADQAEAAGELRKTADFLIRYLAHVPEDNETLCRYGLLLSRLAQTSPQLARALDVLERVLRRQPELFDARLEVIRLNIMLERHGDAFDHLKRLEGPHADHCLVHLLRGRCQEGAGQAAAARESYRAAVAQAQKNPAAYRALDAGNRIELYVRPARFLIRSARLTLLEKQDVPAMARFDTVREARQQVLTLLESLGQQNPDAYQAFLERSRCWQDLAALCKEAEEDPFSLPVSQPQAEARKNELAAGRTEANLRARTDIATAQQLAPEEVLVILAGAELAQQDGRSDDARQLLEQGIVLHPSQALCYRNLALLEAKSNRLLEATDVLRRGLARVPRNPVLLWDLADLLVQQDRLAEARAVVLQLREGGASLALAEYLEARIVVREGRWWQAAQALEQVRPRLRDWPELRGQVDLALGRCWEQLGEPDQQYTVYRRLLAADPLSGPATLGVGSALVAMNKIDEAIDVYERILPFAPAVRIEIARLLMLQNLRTPAAQRQWRRIEQLLNEADKIKPVPSEAVLLRAEVMAARNELQQATDLLSAARDADPAKVELWTGLAAMTDRRSGAAAALAVLDEAERHPLVGDRVELRLARARHWLRRPAADARPAIADLAQNLDKFAAPDRRRLVRGLAQAITQLGDVAEARRAWARVAELQPQDLGARLILFDLAVLANDEPGISQARAEIERVQGPAGTFSQHARACQLVVQARKNPTTKAARDQLTQARSQLVAVAARRPYWARVRVLQAEVEELLGNPEGAAAHYQEAVLQLGESTPAVVTRAIQLLRESKRYAEADTILSRFQDQHAVMDSLDRYEAESLVRRRQFTRAVELAEKAVPADSKSASDHLWLGSILWQCGRPGPAEAALRRAVAAGGKEPAPWLALVRFLVAIDRRDQAIEATERARTNLPAEHASALARCYELVGNRAQAEKLYLSIPANDPAGERALAGYYLRTDRAGQAEPILRRLIETSGKTAQDRAWARRALAMVLAAKQDYQQTLEALTILGVLDSDDPNQSSAAPSSADLRLRALVLTGLGRKQRLEAIRLLEDLGGQQTATDQFLLAQLYEATGDWPKAREKLLGLLANADDSPEQTLLSMQCLVSYVSSLLRRGEVDEAQVWLRKLDRLDARDPQLLATVALKARLLKAQGRNAEIASVLTAYAQKRPEDLGRVALLLEELAQVTAAETCFRKYMAQSQKPQAQLALAEFLARHRRLAEGLDLCDKAWETCPADRVATVSIQMLYTANAASDHQERVAQRLEAALKKQPPSPVLLNQLAAVRNLQGRYPEVVKLYRQVLELDPREPTTLNNLAWFLALTENQPGEAMELIQRAISLKGPLPSLLETRSTIYLVQRKHDLACKDLLSVVADDPSAAAYFRLAYAHFLSGDRRSASQALQEAARRGLTAEELHALEQPAYAQLSRELASK